MKIGALEEYGLRCLLEIARHSERQLGIAEIARAEGLSSAYAGKLLSKLRQGGLVTSARGAKGGYTLTLPAGKISLARVMEALAPMPKNEESICRLFPGKRRECVHIQGACSIRTVWHTIYKNIWALLAETTLEDLLQESGLAGAGDFSPATWASPLSRGKHHAAA